MNTDRPRKIVAGFDEVHFSRALRLIRRTLDCAHEALDELPAWSPEREKLEQRIEALLQFTEHNHILWTEVQVREV